VNIASGLADPSTKGVLLVAAAIALAVGVLAVAKRRFTARAGSWPTVAAKVENVFLDVLSRGLNRAEETHAVLAYSYSIGDAYCSREIRLWAGESSLESLDKEMVGQKVSVHYNPRKPDVSIFLGRDVKGWDVVHDRRTSVWSWL
jgi:hypothetical protein